MTEGGPAGRAISFDGDRLSGRGPALASDEEAIFESLVTDSPEHIAVAFWAGSPLEQLMLRARVDEGTNPLYSGPIVDVYRTSLNGGPLARVAPSARLTKYIAIDSNTKYLFAVQTHRVQNGQRRIAETRFSGWTIRAGQAFPAEIRRLEDGREVFVFTVSAASSAARLPAAAFK